MRTSEQRREKGSGCNREQTSALTDAGEVKPLDLAVLAVARDHRAERHLLARAVDRLIRVRTARGRTGGSRGTTGGEVRGVSGDRLLTLLLDLHAKLILHRVLQLARLQLVYHQAVRSLACGLLVVARRCRRHRRR
jgi:hypothetical protein